jgi:hypothetical protein
MVNEGSTGMNLYHQEGLSVVLPNDGGWRLDNVQNLSHFQGAASSRMKERPMSDETPMGQVIQIDEARIRDHLGEMVRGTVEETLNALLDAEAGRLCNAQRYERSEARQDSRAGSYERTLHTKAGDVSLKVPKLRRQTFETAIIARYRRRESSVEEALIEMYLAGISIRRVEDITEALWGTRGSPSTVSNLNKKIYAKIEAWRNRRGRASLPLPRRDRDEAELGRRGPERVASGGQRGQCRGISRDPRVSVRALRKTNQAGRRSCSTWSIEASRVSN